MASEGKLPFLDLLIIRKDTRAVNLQIYRKPTHTDQYLNFNSHHPNEYKLNVVRTLFDRSQSLISDSTDRHVEDLHIENALLDCGYPDWTFQKVKKQMKTKKKQKKGFSKPALSHFTLCGGYIGKDSPGNEEASGSCCHETSKDFEITTGASKG